MSTVFVDVMPYSLVDRYQNSEGTFHLQLQGLRTGLLEVARSSKMSATIHQPTRYHIPGYFNLHQHCCENLTTSKSKILLKKNNNMASRGTHREVTAHRPDIIIKNKRENMHTDRCGNTSGQKCQVKGSRKETKIKEFA
jgi:hypothetical protein